MYSLADARLVTAEADPQPAIRIEGSRCGDRPPDDGGQRAADLRG